MLLYALYLFKRKTKILDDKGEKDVSFILQKTKTAIWRTPIFVFYSLTALILSLQINLGG